jgi:hypothetical protein
MRAVLRKVVRVLAAAGEMWGYKHETQKDRFSFLPHQNFRRFSPIVGRKIAKPGRGRESPGRQKSRKAVDFTHWPSEHAGLWATALQQTRSTRSRETPAFAYTYCTNRLLN